MTSNFVFSRSTRVACQTLHLLQDETKFSHQSRSSRCQSYSVKPLSLHNPVSQPVVIQIQNYLIIGRPEQLICRKLINYLDDGMLSQAICVCWLLVCALLTALSIPYSQTTWNSVPGFVCMSARFFKMLLLRHFLSDWADFLTRWSPT